MRFNAVARRGRRSAAQARNLIAATYTGESIVRHTDATWSGEQDIEACVDAASGRFYYRVRSDKFIDRVYIVAQWADGSWHSSCDDERLLAKLVARVEAFRAARTAVAA